MAMTIHHTIEAWKLVVWPPILNDSFQVKIAASGSAAIRVGMIGM